MVIDALRRGWPEQILTGRYAFRTRRREGVAGALAEGLRLVSDELLDAADTRQLQVLVGGRPVMVVMQDVRGAWLPAPPGPKVCGIDPVGPLLTLLPVTEGNAGWRIADVLDNRLGRVIGTLETTGGFVRPVRTVILDPSRRVAGTMTEPLASFLFQWLQLGIGWGRRRFTFRVDGRPVARIRQVSRLWAREFLVDVSEVGGRLDPRLVLACGVERFHPLSTS
ncbi:hypothetical protein Asp14428_29990 [Actinoplanes sp. NBRC 14428]|uniref:Uncharacterized protein n=1 Tax=Pseudosporangium ferrugineum TaxID=439699 RepID=A0A2T0RS08_9ACTN|nr:hypothetical protein [Pseudosporangium ferrugineum]PRY23958.1 hypothetical protein CLV70_11491 [Pseudosporangium ferrugineum]BCJ51524.1 hypothetical protein Asp14428_29990 [Actinoplanes sp. NBRC 14428]